MVAFVWLVIIVLFGIVEASTMSLVSIWFFLGAIGGMVAALLGSTLLTQIIVFVTLSAFFIIFTRPFVKNVLKIKKTSTNADRLIGEIAVVTEEIDNLKPSGQVKVLGQIWTARSVENEQIFSEGEQVRVREISGVKLIVTSVE